MKIKDKFTDLPVTPQKKWKLRHREEYLEAHKKHQKTYIKKYPEKRRKLAAYWCDRGKHGGQRDFVYERDNWTCQDCGMTQEQHIVLFDRRLTIHHIDGKGRYSEEKNHDPENLITLCLRCHGREDIKKRIWRKARKA